MTFYIDNYGVDHYMHMSGSGIMYQISEDVFTDFLPHRTAHPGMATFVVMKKQMVSKLPYPYGDCVDSAGYNNGNAAVITG